MNDNVKKISISLSIFIILSIIIGNVLAIENKSVDNKLIGSTENRSTDKYITPSPELKASVSLHGEKTEVVLGENIQIKLSAVNLITNPVMHVQVILIPPSGMSVISSEFSKSGAGQFTTNYVLEPGDGKDIEIKIIANQIGSFNVSGRIIYYFGNDTDNIEDFTQDLFIKVKSPPIKNSSENNENGNIPKKDKYAGYRGIVFTILMLGVMVYMTYILIQRMKKHR